jgi:hypothetical protein
MGECEFQSLYYGDDGYVVRCKHCGHYQVAFICICITFTNSDFAAFKKMAGDYCDNPGASFSDNHKNIIMRTPAQGISFILTRAEIKRLIDILDEADTQEKFLSLLNLFEQ